MSTKQSARQRKELKQHRERMAAKVPHASQMPPDRIGYGVGYFAAAVMVGLVAVAACVMLGVM